MTQPLIGQAIIIPTMSMSLAWGLAARERLVHAGHNAVARSQASGVPVDIGETLEALAAVEDACGYLAHVLVPIVAIRVPA